LLKYSNLSISYDGGRPPFWICGANFGTTHNENLMVIMTVQNLVAMTLVVLIIKKIFEFFMRSALKRLFPPIFGCFGGKKIGELDSF